MHETLMLAVAEALPMAMIFLSCEENCVDNLFQDRANHDDYYTNSSLHT